MRERSDARARGRHAHAASLLRRGCVDGMGTVGPQNNDREFPNDVAAVQSLIDDLEAAQAAPKAEREAERDAVATHLAGLQTEQPDFHPSRGHVRRSQRGFLERADGRKSSSCGGKGARIYAVGMGHRSTLPYTAVDARDSGQVGAPGRVG